MFVFKLELHQKRFIGGEQNIGASWTSSDDESGVAFSKYCVGTTTGGCQLSKMRPVPGSTTNVTCTDCQLKHKYTYFITVRVWNNAGLFNLASTQGVQADLTAPISGYVIVDNLYMPCTNRCTIHATVSGFKDDESGISYFEYTVQSSSGSVVVPVKRATSNNHIEVDGLQLQDGKNYQLVVSCVNIVGGKSKQVYSSPVVIDNSPPEKV